jgi:hypothetical protein
MKKALVAAALLCATLVSTVVPASANLHATTVVRNMTPDKVWVTLYADVGAFGWAIESGCRPGFAASEWRCTTHTDNGPWRLRAEVDAGGKRYDFITNYWYDGAQRRYTSGADSSFYICKDAGGFYWSYTANCSLHNNS